MQILITGGAGFIGSALANRLAKDGHHVRVLDDLSAGNPDNLNNNIHFIRGDVADKPKLWAQLNQIDCVYHLAAKVSVPESILYPTEYNAVNVGGTVALMEAIRDAGVKRVVLASSGAIYGDQLANVVETTPPRPTSPYGVSKLSAEYYVRSIGELWGIETVVLRIFNAYGPGQPLSPVHPPVIPQFIRQIQGGGSVLINGGGQQVRDFVFIDDVVTGLVAAAEKPAAEGKIINIGAGEGTSINRLTKILGRVMDADIDPLHVDSDRVGVSRLVADINLAEKILGYTPQVPLSQGLRRVLQEDARFVGSLFS